MSTFSNAIAQKITRYELAMGASSVQSGLELYTALDNTFAVIHLMYIAKNTGAALTSADLKLFFSNFNPNGSTYGVYSGFESFFSGAVPANVDKLNLKLGPALGTSDMIQLRVDPNDTATNFTENKKNLQKRIALGMGGGNTPDMSADILLPPLFVMPKEKVRLYADILTSGITDAKLIYYVQEFTSST